MKKPKCPECRSSMKRIYQRMGSRGITTTIKHWWYCRKCDQMIIQPIEMSRNKADYIHQDAAEKFPKIATILPHHSLREYRLRDELTGMVDLINKSHNYKKNTFLEYINQNYTILSKSKTKRRSAFAIWICDSCQDYSKVDIDLKSIDDVPEAPIHCDIPMKLAMVPDFEYRKLIRLKKIQNIKRLCSDNEYYEAGIELLDLVLYYLQFYETYNLQKAITELTELYDLSKSPLVDTWGYRTVIAIFSAYSDSDNPIIDRSEFLFITPILNPTINTQYILSQIFNDVIMYFTINSPEKIPLYRLKFIQIEKEMGEISTLNEVLKLSAEYQVNHYVTPIEEI